MSEFAPLYSTRERVALALKMLAVAAPIYIVGFYWLFPWLQDYFETANCDRFGAVSGLELLLYGLFVGMPLSMALLFWLIEGSNCLRVWRLGQSPLPGEKVFRKTRYRYGAAARIRPMVIFALIAILVGVAIRGGFVARELARRIGPCEETAESPAVPGAADKTGSSAAGKLLESVTRQTRRNNHGSIQV
jgi:hypothetical protein